MEEIIIGVASAAIIGGGVWYYETHKKPKPGQKKTCAGLKADVIKVGNEILGGSASLNSEWCTDFNTYMAFCNGDMTWDGNIRDKDVAKVSLALHTQNPAICPI